MQAEAAAQLIYIVLAEDNPGDVLLVREALSLQSFTYELSVHSNGEQMLDFVDRLERGEVQCPDVVILDLNLPRTGGEEILSRLRRTSRGAQVPVVVASSSDSPRDLETIRRLGVTRYFRKPSDYDAFMELGGLIREVLSSR